jgi:GMP synthase-like glutamine amidotransferase
LVYDWLESHRADVHVVPIDERADHDSADAYDLIVSLGSEFSAYDDGVPWIGGELDLLREAIASDVPVLGICFGGQLLARAHGASVFRAPQPEIGWGYVVSDSPSLVPTGPWFQWHFDAFSTPTGATLLAHNDLGPQAFIRGRGLGLQFHPEVELEILGNWVDSYGHELDQQGVRAEELLEQTRAIADTARSASWKLLEGFYDRVALLGRSARR